MRGDEAEYRLTRYLMSNYDKSVRPSLKATMALNITFGLALTQIIDVVSTQREGEVDRYISGQVFE